MTQVVKRKPGDAIIVASPRVLLTQSVIEKGIKLIQLQNKITTTANNR